MTDANRAGLGHYIRHVMKLKGLTQKDVQQKSGGRITDGYVASILTGRANNLSVEKIKALADGLGVEVDELFHVACGATEAEGEQRSEQVPDALLVLDIVQKLVVNPLLIDIFQEVISLSPEDQKIMLGMVRGLARAEVRSKKVNRRS